MYCGIVEVPKKRLEDVLHVAKQLQVKGLYNSSNCDRNPSSTSALIRIENEEDSVSDVSNILEDRNEEAAITQCLHEQSSCKPSTSSVTFSIMSKNLTTEQNEDNLRQGKAPTIVLPPFGTTNDDLEQIPKNQSNLVSRSQCLDYSIVIIND